MTPWGQPSDIGPSYVIEREIGRGGMATVYRAHDRRHNRRVAIKVLDSEVAATLGTARFLQEIATAAGLSHPNIVPVYDSGEHDGVVYYVMPYVEGSTLREQLSGGKRLPPCDVARIAVRIASALDFAHRNGISTATSSPRTSVALDYLQQAVHLGLYNIHWLLNDPDIAGLHDHPRFATVLREAEASTGG